MKNKKLLKIEFTNNDWIEKIIKFRIFLFPTKQYKRINI